MPALSVVAACTLTTSLEGLQSGGEAGQGGENPQGGASGQAVDGAATRDGSNDVLADAKDDDKGEIIAANQRGLRGIAFFKSLYWVDAETPAIWMADAAGAGAQRVLTSAENVNNPFDVDAADKYVFWSEFTSGAVWRAVGTTSGLLGGGLPRAAFLAAMDGSTPLVSDLQGDANGKTVWKNGTRLYSRLERVMGLGHEADNLYWAEPSAIYQGAVDGRDPVKIATAVNATGGVATNGIDVFWIENERELWRQPLGTSAKRRIFMGAGEQKLFDVAASSTFVFWTDPGTQSVRRLKL
ncbi:MAG: hypothetical protein SF187_22430 [Deltaproteobacteria bacterium]|nr:hypothetical protein [Deltaproteobacteria bacterium]